MQNPSRNSEYDNKSSFFGKIDDIEAFVTRNWGYLPNFNEIKEQLIQDVKDHQKILEDNQDKMTVYGDLIRQGKYSEAAVLVLESSPDQEEDQYIFTPRAKIVITKELQELNPEIEEITIIRVAAEELQEDEAIRHERMIQDRIDSLGFMEIKLDLDLYDKDGNLDMSSIFPLADNEDNDDGVDITEVDVDLCDIEYYKDVGAVDVEYEDEEGYDPMIDVGEDSDDGDDNEDFNEYGEEIPYEGY